METIKYLKKVKKERKQLKKLPDTPGIYFFWSINKTALYIGKAINVKKRVTSYFSKNLQDKTTNMVAESTHISYLKVGSELEALVLEAKLISTYKPKYNAVLKDDKKPLYIKITKEEYPRVITARKLDKSNSKDFFGPFPSGYKVRQVLRMLRKIFPFADHLPGKRACIYSHMGLCNPCPSELELLEKDKKAKKRRKYLANIRNIRGVLSGRINSVTKDLEKEMKTLAKSENYEKAMVLREKIKNISYITQPITSIAGFLQNPNLIEDIRQKETNDLQSLLKAFVDIPELRRIECFDVAHMAGTNPTASMVTFIDGEPDKSLYRRFRIRQKKGASDTDSLAEVALRRLSHLSTWGVPDLVLVDGGKGQVSVFDKAMKDQGILVVGIAKQRETLVFVKWENGKKIYQQKVMPAGDARNLVQRLRNEAHRFARRYHHKLVAKTILGE